MAVANIFAADAENLSPKYPTLILLLAIFAVFIVFEFRSWYRLRHIPGPFYASISALWMVRKGLRGRLHEDLRDVSEAYGPLVRIGPNELLSTDPEVVRMMSSVRSQYTKGIFYKTGRVIPHEDNVVSMLDEKGHKGLRGKMAFAFGGKENEGFGFSDGVDRQLLEFINLIDTKYISTTTDYRPVQFFRKVSFLTLDVISDISFGDAFGFLAQDQDLYRYHAIHDDAMPVMNIISTMPWLIDVLHNWPFTMLIPKEGDQQGFGRLMGLAKSLIDKRYQPGARPKKDMMQAFIEHGMTRAELTQQIFVQIVAGSHTTATAICMTLLCLMTTPAAYMALQKEIDNAHLAGMVSSPINESQAKRLPYLQAVIREGLRMYPPTTGLGDKQVPKGGDVINGYFVPEGTQVGTNIFGLMRLKSIWGDDAEVFRPERWLGATEQQRSLMNSVVDLDFESGKYQCLGKQIAMTELNKVFFELLRRYDFTIVNPQRPMSAWSAIFWVADDFWLRITRRANSASIS